MTTQQQIARKALTHVAQDKTAAESDRNVAAMALLNDAYTSQDAAVIVAMERWYEVDTKDLTVFFLKTLAALLPAGMLVFVLYVFVYLSAVVLTSLVQ